MSPTRRSADRTSVSRSQRWRSGSGMHSAGPHARNRPPAPRRCGSYHAMRARAWTLVHELGSWFEANHGNGRRGLCAVCGIPCERGEPAFRSGREAAKGGLLQLVGDDAHQQVTAQPSRRGRANQLLPMRSQLSRGAAGQSRETLYKRPAIIAPQPGAPFLRPAHCDAASARW